MEKEELYKQLVSQSLTTYNQISEVIKDGDELVSISSDLLSDIKSLIGLMRSFIIDSHKPRTRSSHKREDYYWVPYHYGKFTPSEEYLMSGEELDKVIDKYEGEIYRMIEGREGAMAMWACFLNHLSVRGNVCYSSAINAYSLMSNDHKSLVDREHELRHKWNEYEELWRIRYHGSYIDALEDELEDEKNRTPRKRMEGEKK